MNEGVRMKSRNPVVFLGVAAFFLLGGSDLLAQPTPPRPPVLGTCSVNMPVRAYRSLVDGLRAVQGNQRITGITSLPAELGDTSALPATGNLSADTATTLFGPGGAYSYNRLQRLAREVQAARARARSQQPALPAADLALIDRAITGLNAARAVIEFVGGRAEDRPAPAPRVEAAKPART